MIQDLRLSAFQRAVIVGTLLGDSSLSTPLNGRNAHLSCYHAIKQRDWLIKKHQWLQPFVSEIQWCSYTDKRDGKTRHGGRFHSISIPPFSILDRLLYHGKHRRKRITSKFLSMFRHPVSLACLICDDGSWDKAGIAISTKNFTIADNNRLTRHLRRVFHIHVTVQRNQKYPFIRIPATSIERVRILCGEFIPSSLLYKLGPPNYKTHLTGKVTKLCRCGRRFTTYASANQRFCSRGCAAKGRAIGTSRIIFSNGVNDP